MLLPTSLTLRLIISDFSSVPFVFCQFFSWIALSDADLCFWLMLVRKAKAVEEKTKWTTWLHHQHNQSIHVTDGVTVMSHSAILLQKTIMAMDHLWQIVLNWKLSYKVEEWCKFSSHIKAKLHKNKSCKTKPACTLQVQTGRQQAVLFERETISQQV